VALVIRLIYSYVSIVHMFAKTDNGRQIAFIVEFLDKQSLSLGIFIKYVIKIWFIF